MTSPLLFLLLLATIFLNFILQSLMVWSDYTIAGCFFKYLVVADRLPVPGPIINIMNEEWTNSITSLKDSSVCNAPWHCNQKSRMLKFVFLFFCFCFFLFTFLFSVYYNISNDVYNVYVDQSDDRMLWLECKHAEFPLQAFFLFGFPRWPINSYRFLDDDWSWLVTGS